MTKRRTVVIEVLPSKDHGWFFHVRWTNGQIAIVSETYTRFQAAFKMACKLHEMFNIDAVLAVPESKEAILRRYIERLES